LTSITQLRLEVHFGDMAGERDVTPETAEGEFEFVGDGDSGWWFPKADLEAVRADPRSRRLAEILRKFDRELRECGNASTRRGPEI